MDQQFGGTKLKPLSDHDIQNLDKPQHNDLPPIPSDNDPIVAARKVAQTKQATGPKKDELEDKAINMHPVLRKLKKTLGINRLEIFEETVYVDSVMIKFGFTEYPEDLNIWCAAESRRLLNMGVEEEKAMKAFDILRVGCSLVSIDGAPSYEVYGINPKTEEVRPNSYDLSNRLRKAVAFEFHKFVTEEGRAFIDVLEDFWQQKILNRVSIQSAGERVLNKGENVYVCETAGCDFTHSGKDVPGGYVCVRHSTPLKKALTSEETDSLPLA